MCIKDSVLNKIKKIEHDSVISCIELENRNKIVHNKFIFMNPQSKDKILQGLSVPVKYRRDNLSDSKYKTTGNNFKNDIVLSRGFMSLDNYYKFIKNNIHKLSGSQSNMITSESKRQHLKIFNENNNKEEDKKSRQKNRFRIYNTENKGFLPELKQSRNERNRMNYVLLNKDVKFQVKRSYNNQKRIINKDKYYLNFNDYDYKNFLNLFKC